MASHDSDSDLAGKLGASLTARSPHVHLPPRGPDSSGFIDLDSLYVREVEPMRVRAARPSVPPPMPVMRAPMPIARAPLPFPALPHDVVLREMMGPRAAPRPHRARHPRPIGWYAVFVAWLAMATLAAGAATQMPAHRPAHMRSALASPPPPATTVAASTPSPALPALAARTSTASPALAAAAITTARAIPSWTPGSPPVFSIADLPRALPPQKHGSRSALSTRAHAHAAAASRAAATAPAAADDTDDDASSDDAESSDDAPSASPSPSANKPSAVVSKASVAATKPAAAAPAPPPASAPEPAARAAAASTAPPAPKTAPAAGAPAPADTSLEDLIRAEVAKEQKKLHPAARQ